MSTGKLQDFIKDLITLNEAGTLTPEEAEKLANQYGFEIVDPQKTAAEDAAAAKALQNTIQWVYGQSHDWDPFWTTPLYGPAPYQPPDKGGPSRPQMPR